MGPKDQWFSNNLESIIPYWLILDWLRPNPINDQVAPSPKIFSCRPQNFTYTLSSPLNHMTMNCVCELQPMSSLSKVYAISIVARYQLWKNKTLHTTYGLVKLEKKRERDGKGIMRLVMLYSNLNFYTLLVWKWYCSFKNRFGSFL